MKGISAVIATILMLLIVLALAATAYYYFTVVFTGKTAKVVSVVDMVCTTGTNVNVVLKNDGTSNILATDITTTIDGSAVTITGSCTPVLPLVPQGTTSCTVGFGNTTGVHTFRIVTPSNAERFSYSCA